MKIKRTVTIISCAFIAVISFFNIFGGVIRQSLYVPVTTAEVEMQYGTFAARRVVPNEAVHEDMFGSYVWIICEADDIGKPYFYVTKVSVELLERDDINAYVRTAGMTQGLYEGTVVVITSGSELEDKTKVRIVGGEG